MHDSVKDGGERQNFEMAAVWQLAFWSPSLFWKISAIQSDGLPESVFIFPSFMYDEFDLPWFIWRWWWQWWRGNHPKSDSQNAYSKKCTCLSFLCAVCIDPVFLHCMHFLSSFVHHPLRCINSEGKNCFGICWPQLLCLWNWMFAINLLVWASFQPLSEWLRFHCHHLPQMNQDQSRVKDGKMGWWRQLAEQDIKQLAAKVWGSR